MTATTATALTNGAEAAELERLRQLVSQLQTALDSRVAIEQAKGVLMERFSLNPEQAFELLRRAARNQRQPINTLAALVTATPTTAAQVAAVLKRNNRYRIEPASRQLKRAPSRGALSEGHDPAALPSE